MPIEDIENIEDIKTLVNTFYDKVNQDELLSHVFNDVAKVWYKEEVSKRWHYVAGGGFYYNPFNLVILSATVGYSREDRVFNISLGTKFNLTY